jgi:hypothetical protein
MLVVQTALLVPVHVAATLMLVAALAVLELGIAASITSAIWK